MTRRKEPIFTTVDRPPPGVVRKLIDTLQAVFSREVAILDVCLLFDNDGITVTDAAASPGDSLVATTVALNLGDAGIDQLRLLVYGNNSAAGSVTVQVYDLTNSAVLATVTVTDATPDLFIGEWTRIVPTQEDQEVEIRVVGDGAFDPLLYSVHLQGRTNQVRA